MEVAAMYWLFTDIVKYRQHIGRRLTLNERVKILQLMVYMMNQIKDEMELTQRVSSLVEQTKMLERS
jgi:hypothetical protein